MLLDIGPGTPVSAGALRRNCELAIRYLGNWLAGRGVAPIFNRATDASTFGCVYAHTWHLPRSSMAVLADGRRIDIVLIRKAIMAALQTILAEPRDNRFVDDRWTDAAALFERMCIDDQLETMTALPDRT